MSALLEGVGALLLVAFAFFIWPPAALLVAGLALIAAANAGGKR